MELFGWLSTNTDLPKRHQPRKLDQEQDHGSIPDEHNYYEDADVDGDIEFSRTSMNPSANTFNDG